MFNVKFVYFFYLIFFQVSHLFIYLFIHEAYSSFITIYIYEKSYSDVTTAAGHVLFPPQSFYFVSIGRSRKCCPSCVYLDCRDRTEEEIHPQEFGEVSSLSCWQFDRRRCSPQRSPCYWLYSASLRANRKTFTPLKWWTAGGSWCPWKSTAVR